MAFNFGKLGKVMLPTVLLGGIIGFGVLFSPLIFGVNDLGERTVIQYPWGSKTIKFDNGWYFQGFGKVTEYGDYLTYDFSPGKGGEATLDTDGIAVRYRDGGTGSVHGKARYALPNDYDSMMKLHKAFKSHKGVASKLILPITEEAMNLTAGLLTSEGAYAEERGRFIELSGEQIKKGRIKTTLEENTVTDPVTGQVVVKNIPVPMYDNGQYIHVDAGLLQFGIHDVVMQITDWNFEPKTMDQIDKKREATMSIITSKANAEKAKQDALTTQEQGKANVMKARYEANVIKERAIVEAERLKKVAEIKAEQRVAVAAQAKLEAEQNKLTAIEYKQEQILIGEGDAERKRLVFEADGALSQKLNTYEVVMTRVAEAFSQQKWTPEIVMGGSDSGDSSNQAMALIDLLSVKTAKDLSLDLTVTK
jgi:regulator of protease activity HflC (stomatin/prohibitin superfamily)